MNNSLKILMALAFLMLCNWPSFTQELDTIAPQQDINADDFNAEDTLVVSIDSLNFKLKFIDTTKVPAALIYPNWNNNLVNPYDINLEKKADTTIIDISGYVQPIYGRITSDFGWRRWKWHYGVDLKLNVGDTIHCAFDGMIRIARLSPSFGNFIVVRHYNGLETVYGHLSKLLVLPNQPVKAGEVIGLGGNTGKSTGPHLHFEMRYLGNSINPHDVVQIDSGMVKADKFLLCQNNFSYITEIHKIRFHRVRSGDTLYKISRRYGVSISMLCRLNRIKRTKILRLGQSIRYT